MAKEYQVENLDLSCVTSTTFSIVSVTLYIIVIVVTIVGNLLVILSIYKYSIMSLLGISFDRFMAVVFPLKHFMRTNKRNTFVVLLSGMWIISILSGSLPVILVNLQPPNSTFVCRVGAIMPLEFNLIASVLIIVVIIINFVLYGMVIWKIKTNKTPGNSASKKKNTKTVLMIIVFVIFVVCWMPFVICSIMLHADISTSTLQSIWCVREYVVKLGMVNSALNWILYGLANQKFRTAFKKILCCKCCLYVSRTSSTLSEENRMRQSINDFDNPVDSKVTRKGNLNLKGVYNINAID